MEAVNWLEGIAYHQRSYIVENYIYEFQILISETNYINLHTIVVKFAIDFE